MSNNIYKNKRDDYEDFEGNCYDYTQDDLDRMYREAFEGEPEAYWNID